MMANQRCRRHSRDRREDKQFLFRHMKEQIKNVSKMQLDRLFPGMVIPFGGDRTVSVSTDLASAFRVGEALVVCQTDGALLHIQLDIRNAVNDDISASSAAFILLSTRSDRQIGAFFEHFAHFLEDDAVWSRIVEVNGRDIANAHASGRSTGRLSIGPSARAGMIWTCNGFCAGQTVIMPLLLRMREG